MAGPYVPREPRTSTTNERSGPQGPYGQSIDVNSVPRADSRIATASPPLDGRGRQLAERLRAGEGTHCKGSVSRPTRCNLDSPGVSDGTEHPLLVVGPN